MKIKMCAALATTIALASGCGILSGGSTEEEGADSGPIKIGAAIAESGEFSVEGRGLRDGYQLWADTVNKQGGIDVGGTKRRVEMIYHDDQSDPETASQLTERLITKDKVDFLFGPYSSGLTMATSAIAERHRKINMSGGGADEEIFQRGFRHVFGIATPTKDYTSTILDELKTRDVRTAGIVHIDDAPMTSVADGAVAKAKELGIKIVANETVPQDADYTAAMQRVSRAKPDVFIGAGAFQAAVSFTRISQQIGFSPNYMVLVNGPGDPEFVSELGKSSERIMGPTQWHRSAQYEDEFFGTAEEFAQKFDKATGDEPSYVAAMGAASALSLQLAIEKAGSTETKKVQQALLDLDAKTFCGPVNFADNGINEDKPMPGVQIQDGKSVVVAPPQEGESQVRKYAD